LPDPTPPPAVVAPPNLFLTGISFLNGLKRAYLVVNRPPTNSADYLAVEEGYDSDGLKVVDIDPRKHTVRVVNSGTELTLNFKDNGMKASTLPVPGHPVPGQKGAPGLPPVRLPSSSMPVPTAANAGGGPTIIGRGGVVPDGAAVAPVAAGNASADNAGRVRTLPARRGVYLGGAANDATTPVPITLGGPAAPTANTVPAVPAPVANPGAGFGREPPPIPGGR
jgi:hypothetical protein